MKLCTIYGTTLRVHPLFPMMLLVFLLGGQGLLILAYLLALLFHEAGHIFVASRLDLTVTQIELTPFGGLMQIEESEGLTGKRGFLLASAGIAVNLTFLLLTAPLLAVRASPFLLYFLLAHLSMLAINLTPVLPLDGGRMLMALLAARLSRVRVFRGMLLGGRILACLLILFSLYRAVRGAYRPSFAILGCYLLYSSFLEEKQSAARYITALFSRRYKTDSGQALPVQYLCANENISLHILLPQLSPRAYHLIAVLDDTGCEVLGTVTEKELYEAVLEQPQSRLRDLL